MLRKVLPWIMGITTFLAVAVFVAFQVSPWPSVVIYRYVFSKGGAAMNHALAKHVPPGITGTLGEHYDPDDHGTTFDIFHPAATGNDTRTLPTIIWVHGGGFVAGTKDEIANYLRILASKGYAVIGVNYALAPGNTYPTPVRQVNAALSFIVENAQRLRVDAGKLFLAGDSAGAQIAAQLIIAIVAPAYAVQIGIAPAIRRQQLLGAILHCGFHDPEALDVSGRGLAGGFVRNVGWAYFGRKDFLDDPRAQQFSIVRNITSDFPPMFISAGNADPLEPQSRRLAEAASKLGIPVDSLFFARNYTPPLPHEYQFNLDTEAGRLALERKLAFLRARAN